MAENTTPGSAEYVSPDVSTIGGKYTEMRKYGKSEQVVFKDQKEYPIVPMILKMGAGGGTVDANKFFIWEDEDEPLKFTPAAASSSVDGTNDGITLANASARQFKINDIVTIDGLWYPGTGTTSYTTPAGTYPALEQARIKSIQAAGASNTVLVLDRPATTQITTSMPFLKSGSAQPDGWTAGSGFAIEPESRYQYVQNFSRVWEVDENRLNENSWGEDDMKRLTRMKRRSWNRELAYYTWWGRRGIDTLSDGKQRRKFGGLIEDIPEANFTRRNGPITISWMRQQATTWAERGSDTKYMFIGPTASGYLDVKLKDYLRFNDTLPSRFGIPELAELTLGPLRLRIVHDWSFLGTALADGFVIVDLEYQKFKWMQGMEPKVLTRSYKDVKNNQNQMTHTIKHELYCGATLWRTFPESNHIVYTITG